MIIKFNKATQKNFGAILFGLLILSVIIGFQVLMYYGFRDFAREYFGNHADIKLMSIIGIAFVMSTLAFVGAFFLPTSTVSNSCSD